MATPESSPSADQIAKALEVQLRRRQAEQLNAAIKGGSTMGSSGTQGTTGSGKPDRR